VCSWFETTGAQGSGILTSMVKANCLIDIPVEVERVSLGDLVSVQLLSGVAWPADRLKSHKWTSPVLLLTIRRSLVVSH